jgi:Resolvase, N terminal domain
MLDRLARGDVVTVTRIDRLARSTFDLFGIVKRIVDAKAQFRSLAEPWADTAGRHLRELVGNEFEMAFDQGEVGTSLIDLPQRQAVFVWHMHVMPEESCGIGPRPNCASRFDSIVPW